MDCSLRFESGRHRRDKADDLALDVRRQVWRGQASTQAVEVNHSRHVHPVFTQSPAAALEVNFEVAVAKTADKSHRAGDAAARCQRLTKPAYAVHRARVRTSTIV